MTEKRRDDLLRAVAACAREAANLSLDDVAPDKISVRSWNAGRPRVAEAFGWLPRGQELQRQLTGSHAPRTSWGDLLDQALRKAADG